MKKKSILSVLSMFLMIAGICITASCGNDEIESDPQSASSLSNENSDNDTIPSGFTIPDDVEPICIVGDYLTDVSGETGIARWDHQRFPIADERYHNNPYIETANGDRYYLFPKMRAMGDYLGDDYTEEFNKEFVIGAKMEFSGKVFKINPEYVALDALFAEILKTTNVYIMRAPDFSVKRISE